MKWAPGYKLKCYEPEEEVRENCQGLNCAYVNSTGAILTPTFFTQFLLGIIASHVRLLESWKSDHPFTVSYSTRWAEIGMRD